MAMKQSSRFQERLTSKRTLALFAALTAVFSGFLAWRLITAGLDGWGLAFLILAAVFLFYTINYRVLHICLTDQALILQFGIITWRVAGENIANCQVDQLPTFKRYGGAGVHFMFIDRRYRANFNFLEYPRLIISLKRKTGPVADISFSTRHPDKLIQLIQAAKSTKDLSE